MQSTYTFSKDLLCRNIHSFFPFSFFFINTVFGLICSPLHLDTLYLSSSHKLIKIHKQKQRQTLILLGRFTLYCFDSSDCQSIMATPEVLQRNHDLFIDHPQGENVKPRGMTIEKKIEVLESLTGNVSNRRTRRWLNDRLLMELVPRLNAEEIRGLFAPPPWGDDVPLSPFCLTTGGDWDKFRNIDMDREVKVIETLESSSSKRKGHVDVDKMSVLAAWHRVDCRTREALRRSFLAELIDGYEECIRAFIKESGDGDVLVLHVQDPFHRLLLHGVCEFYDVVSVTETRSKGMELTKTTRIKKKKAGSAELPNITLCNFLKMAKEGIW